MLADANNYIQYAADGKLLFNFCSPYTMRREGISEDAIECILYMRERYWRVSYEMFSHTIFDGYLDIFDFRTCQFHLSDCHCSLDRYGRSSMECDDLHCGAINPSYSGSDIPSRKHDFTGGGRIGCPTATYTPHVTGCQEYLRPSVSPHVIDCQGYHMPTERFPWTTHSPNSWCCLQSKQPV